ncbi:MAG: hypothetical protein HZY76_07830 [Anaerolineae bacterium]|nr:MAG: hypothetical protein HZY76_07830 [Anaerolineae bacterium]
MTARPSWHSSTRATQAPCAWCCPTTGGRTACSRSTRPNGASSPTAPRALLQFTDETGGTFSVWLNNDTGYLHGLKDWYAAHLVPAGGIFYIERSPGSHYNFKVRIIEAASRTFDGKQYFCEVDRDTYIEGPPARPGKAARQG